MANKHFLRSPLCCHLFFKIRCFVFLLSGVIMSVYLIHAECCLGLHLSINAQALSPGLVCSSSASTFSPPWTSRSSLSCQWRRFFDEKFPQSFSHLNLALCLCSWPWAWMLKLNLKPNTLGGQGVRSMKESRSLLPACQLISFRLGSLLPCATEITVERDFDRTWVIVVVVDLPDVYWLGLFSPEAPCSLRNDDCLDWLCSSLRGLFLCSLPHTKSTDSHHHERPAVSEYLPVVLAL